MITILRTLQSELEDTIRELANHNYKVVFIIDELDKLREERVRDAVESLKALLNHSPALFVLITGKELFDLVMKASLNRGKEYTMFSQKIFLPRPQFAEIRKFMDKIIIPKNDAAIIKLFPWDMKVNEVKLGEFLQKKSIHYNFLVKIESAMVTKKEDTITIIYKRDENDDKGALKPKEYKVAITKDPNQGVAILSIPSITNKDIVEEYVFGLMEEKKELLVYTHSEEFRRFQYYATYASKADFFDLYNVIRDHIEYLNGIKMILS